MDDMDKSVKLELLQMLMDEMDGHAMKKFNKKDPMAQVTEVSQREMPMSSVKDMMAAKMGKDPMVDMEEDMDAPAKKELETAAPGVDVDSMDEEGDEDVDSSLMDRLKAMRAKKAMQE